ncbi:MAG: winged helix-turn-helix transcriptional regulator, partial [Fervidicoccaceae archaeon]
YVRRRIKKLEKSGIGFRANFDLRKIGLSTLAVIFKEPLSFDPVTRIKGFDKNLPYILRWHGNVTFPNPMGIALFYVPYNIEVKDSVMKLLKRCQLPEVIEAYELNVTQYDDLDLRRELLLNDIKSRWKNLTNKILEESNTYEKPSNLKEIDTYIESKHIDLIDIIILAVLQNNALSTMSEISNLLGLTIGKINRHLQSHLISQRIIDGVSLKKRSITLTDATNLFLIVKGKTENNTLLEYVIKEISRSIEFLSAVYNSITGEYLILLLVKTYDVEKIDKYLHRIFGEVLGGEYFIGVLNKNSIKSYTIPFISFNREERNWDLDLQLMDVMRQKLLDILKY